MRKLLTRPVYFTFGWIFVALGMVGAVLPIMPTVPFLLVGVWCFARSSQRFHDWLYHHPVYGSSIRKWDLYGVIPVWAKIWAVLAMAGGLSLTWFITDTMPDWAFVLAGAIMAVVAAWICTRPSLTPDERETQE